MQPIPFGLGGRSIYITGQCWAAIGRVENCGSELFYCKIRAIHALQTCGFHSRVCDQVTVL